MAVVPHMPLQPHENAPGFEYGKTVSSRSLSFDAVVQKLSDGSPHNLCIMKEVRSLAAPPEAEASLRRQSYLHRLGIQRGRQAKPLTRGPARAAGAPGQPGTTADVCSDDTEGEAMTTDVPAPTSQSDFREDFLRKLSYSKVWVPQAHRPPKYQTVIIFDWDDTLLCTSFLNMCQDQALPPVVERAIMEIQSTGRRLLEMAVSLGHTFVITNATSGWVEYSAAKWVPDLLPILQKVRVISARTNYEPQFPDEIGQWKIQAFLEIQRQLDSQIITNLVSLGDSKFEMDAVCVMGKEFAQAFVKTIKFRERPSVGELAKQLALVTQKFRKIVEHARNLTIKLERRDTGALH